MILFDSEKHSLILDKKIDAFVSSNPFSKKLRIVQIGDDPPSEKYVNLKKAFCEKHSIGCEIDKFSSQLSNDTIKNSLEKIVRDDTTGGIIIQLPLPRKSLNFLLDLIPDDLDIDGLSSNKYTHAPDFKSPVVRAFSYFCQTNGIILHNKSVCLLGYGKLVGQPIHDFLIKQRAKTYVLDINNPYLPGTDLNYDLLISSVGISSLVDPSDIVAGCHVVDFGSAVVNGKTMGDIDYQKSITHLGYVAKSPGGLGPLVVRFLVLNMLGI